MDIFSVKDLRIEFPSEQTIRPAVDSVSFSVAQNTTTAIVGESGSGKTVSCLSSIGLVPGRGKITSGKVHFLGENLLEANSTRLSEIHGKDIAVIFQDPSTSLNPVHPVGNQIAEVLQIHQGISRTDAVIKTVLILKQVGISDPEMRIKNYPHQLSGGMNQRIMIAMAIACKPKLLIADEPTTALDLTVQAQIIQLLGDLKAQNDLSLIIITHDFGVVAEIADQVVVMYAGRIAEEAPVGEIYENPAHPYTKGLIESMPSNEGGNKKLAIIPGYLPPPFEIFTGCIFEPRCSYAIESCSKKRPELLTISPGHKVACFNPRTKS